MWKTIGTKRNEPLDIRNYAYAALLIANPNLERKYTTEAIKQTKAVKKRKILSKGI